MQRCWAFCRFNFFYILLDFKTVRSIIIKVKKVIIVEEAFKDSGLGTSILESMPENLKSHVHKIYRIGLQNKFHSN